MIRIIILLLISFALSLPGSSYSEEADIHADSIGSGGIDISYELRTAIITDDVEKVRLFIEQGAPVNTIYDDGLTPLFEAIARSNGSTDIIHLLLRSGADPKLKPNGSSALSMALRTNDERLIALFRAFAGDTMEFYELAAFYRDKNDGKTAITYADAALKVNPSNYLAWEMKGAIFLSQKDLKNAEMAYRKAFQASLMNLKAEKSSDSYKFTGWYALLSADFNDALSLSRDGLSLFPGSGDISMNMGHALLLSGNTQEALTVYRKSLNEYKLSDETRDDAAQLFVNDFSRLKERYPDKTARIEWAEKRLLAPFDFTCDEIPFDEEKDRILGLAEGAAIQQDTTPSIEFLDPVLNKYFDKGIRADGHDAQFDPRAVQKYIVRFEKWDAVEQIDLFFTAGSAKQERLFLASKLFKEQPGTLDAFFSTMRDALTQELKIQPALHLAERMTHIGSEPAKLSIWELNDRTVILEVFNTSSQSAQPRLLCVSKKGWDLYRSSFPVDKRQ